MSLARIEERIDLIEAQLEEMRQVRSAALWQGIPILLFVAVPVFGAFGWGPSDPLPMTVGGVLVASVAAFGVAAHWGVRRGERRLAEIEEEFATRIGRTASDRRDGGARDEQDGGVGERDR